MKKNLSLFLVLMTVSFCTKSQIVNNWRGENRTGIYNETNLLKEWPAKGPEMLWSFDGLGKGFSSPAIDGEKLYITGLEGDDGFLFVFSFEGKLEKKVSYGKEVSSNDQYPGTRSTPTIAGNLLYLATSFGKLFCMDITTYKKVWEKDLFSDFDGKNIRWNFTENVLIDGDVIFVAPGGKKNNVVALNRHNGNLIWNSAGKSELSAYCSPLLINHNGRKMLITMMGENTLGLDATTGNVLWSFQYKNQHNIYPNTPIYYNDKLLIFSGYGKGSVLLQLNKEGTGVTQVWENTRVDPQMGGAVLIDGNIYTSGHRTKRWFCVDLEI
jgi:outer membrane protein assembly factor BamB